MAATPRARRADDAIQPGSSRFIFSFMKRGLRRIIKYNGICRLCTPKLFMSDAGTYGPLRSRNPFS